MRKILMLATAAGLMAFASHANAEPPPPPKGDFGQKMMEKVDTDGDGKISKAEFMASHEEHFAKTDADGDGYLTSEEMKAAWEGRHEKRKDMREKMGDKWREHKEMRMGDDDTPPPADDADTE